MVHSEVISNDSLQGQADLLATHYKWMAFGDGTGSATNLDMALQNEVFRAPHTYTTTMTPTGIQIDFMCRILPGDLDTTIREVAIANTATVGTGRFLIFQNREDHVCDPLHGGEFHASYFIKRGGV